MPMSFAICRLSFVIEHVQHPAISPIPCQSKLSTISGESRACDRSYLCVLPPPLRVSDEGRCRVHRSKRLLEGVYNEKAGSINPAFYATPNPGDW